MPGYIHQPVYFFYGSYLYITDTGNNKIKKIDTNGNVTTVAGSTAGYADGIGSAAKFNNPSGLVVDNAGVIFVADYANNCIREINGTVVTTFAGVGGVSGDLLGAAATAKFNRPTDLCVDPQGNMYVTDQINNKVKVISGGMVTLLAGSGTQASVDGTGAGASFYKPAYIGIDLYHGTVFVTEWFTNKVRHIDVAGGVVTTLTGTGASGNTDGALNVATFYSPYGMCVDNTGNLYIGDKLNNVIRKISANDVGINENTEIAGLSIFPNPTVNSFKIQNDANEPVDVISIYNMNGTLVKQLKLEFYTAPVGIDISELASGTYWIEAVFTNGKISVGRIIKD
ncbi:hypothetical protein BH11BAC7_BH11BAC7_32370 [soil metagenome]